MLIGLSTCSICGVAFVPWFRTEGTSSSVCLECIDSKIAKERYDIFIQSCD